MNKLLGAMEKAYKKIPKKLIDGLYLAAFALVLIYDYCFLTRFDRGPFRFPYIAGAALAGIVLALRFLNVKNENKAVLGFAAVLLILGGGYLLIRHSFYFLVMTMLIAGALRVEDKKMLWVYLPISALFFIVMVTHYLITTPEWKDETIIHFGSINSTDCQAMLFFIVTAYLFCRGSRIRLYEIILLGAVVLWFWYYTHAENNMYCSMACLVMAGFVVFGRAKGIKTGGKKRRIIGYVFSFSFLVCAAVMILLCVRYRPENEKWAALNELLHQRLASPRRMLTFYPASLWGSEFVQVGWGYTPGADYWELYAQYGYTYIDSSYPNILINHGYLILALVLGVMTFVSFRYAKKGMLYHVLLLTVIAVDCAAEGHLKELSCNLWLLFPLAAIGDEESAVPTG